MDTATRFHFVGIGGIGMSGIAHVMLRMGYKVSGSDLEMNDMTRRIEQAGGDVYEGHRAENVPADTGVVVYSTSIATENPEISEAAKRRIPVVHRAEVLSKLFNEKKGIGVTGTHGKTTTTSMISVVLAKAGLDPTVIIGGEVACFDGNSSCGKGEYMVAEADESDRSFLHLKPYCAVVTNIEPEHLDHYSSIDDIKASFRQYVDSVKAGGMLVYCHDDMNVREVVQGSNAARRASYGFSEEADIYPVDIRMDGFRTTYTCVCREKTLGTVRLSVPGRHNVQNSLAAVLVGIELGIPFKTIAAALKAFSGAKRRFQLRCEKQGVMLIDDYAHHPTEIRAVLSACRNWNDKRVIVVFQPHRYTRTKFLADEFGSCFKGADKVILTDIYAASERPIEGVSIATIYDRVKASGIDDVAIVEKEAIADHVMRIKRPGDMILVLGAGDIKKVADLLAERIGGGPRIDCKAIGLLRRVFKGKISVAECLGPRTSFKIGGPADIWLEPHDASDLRRALSFVRKQRMPFFLIGNGSNVLIDDAGFRGAVIRLAAPYFTTLGITGTTVRVGAGFSLPRLVKTCCDKGLAGLESLAGIPGTVGGAVAMNAGGWANPIYRNIGEFVTAARVMDRAGKVSTMRKGDLKFGYRSSNLDGRIILDVTLKLTKADKRNLVASLAQFVAIKKEKQALDVPSAGCVFKNVPGSQFTCGQMIDMLGLKGKRLGGAEVSGKHANFIVNRGGATARDVLSLIDFIAGKMRESYRVSPELEIKVI